ncbi:MAG TPA: molybdenum cofactor guanylyltransferase [Nocardioidaceae bacterium]|nr:molybdenum cofactor guanylyltransferase [Nocardioidaceae bacterium]
MRTAPFDAIVLSGGRATRLGGADKAEVVVAGKSLLDRAREAVAGAHTVVVVGPDVAGGPVAGVAAGLRDVTAPAVVLLACDMPLVSRETVARLLRALQSASDADGALLTDGDGRRQYLAGAYRTAPLRTAVRGLGTAAGRSMRRLVSGLRLTEVAAQAEEAMDCDTWPDVDRALRLLEER